MKCPKCTGMVYSGSDHYGEFETCWNCGWARDIEVGVVPSLWTEAGATLAPGGPRGGSLNRPFGRVIKLG